MARGAVLALCMLIAAAPATAASPYRLSLLRGFANPEDLELVPAIGVLLVGEMGFDAPLAGGGISAVSWSRERGISGAPRRLWPSNDALAPIRELGDPDCPGPPDPSAFSGHGLSVQETSAVPRVAIVGHGAREAVEFFELHGTESDVRARWAGCVVLPRDSAGNDVVLASDGSILVTNYIPTVHGLRAWIWLQVASFGWDTGAVLRWDPAGGWSELPESHGSMPNGILHRQHRTYVAYNGAGKVVVLPHERSPEPRSLAVPGAPDNLSAGPDGRLLAALLQPSPPGAWSIASIDPSLGSLKVLFTHDGSRLPSVTSAVSDGSRYFFGSMASDSLGVLEPNAAQKGAAADVQQRVPIEVR